MSRDHNDTLVPVGKPCADAESASSASSPDPSSASQSLRRFCFRGDGGGGGGGSMFSECFPRRAGGSCEVQGDHLQIASMTGRDESLFFLFI